jgi:hypothetical protein
MAVPTGITETYDLNGLSIREDLADIIYNIAPSDTPFMSNVGKGTSKGTLHEWQKDTLDTAADNTAIEGDDAVFADITVPDRLNNYTQISDKTIVISGSHSVSDQAGKATEKAYQMAKKGLELRRDMEVTLAATNKSKVAGASGTARELGSVLSWIGATNSNKAGDGIDPAGDGTGTGQTDTSEGRTDGTPRTFTEAMLTDVIDQVYLSGGNPDVIMSNTTQKRVITGFTGNATKYKEVDDKKIVNAVDVYVGDYGDLAVVPNRFMRQSEVFVLETGMCQRCSYWKLVCGL